MDKISSATDICVSGYVIQLSEATGPGLVFFEASGSFHHMSVTELIRRLRAGGGTLNVITGYYPTHGTSSWGHPGPASPRTSGVQLGSCDLLPFR